MWFCFDLLQITYQVNIYYNQLVFGLLCECYSFVISETYCHQTRKASCQLFQIDLPGRTKFCNQWSGICISWWRWAWWRFHEDDLVENETGVDGEPVIDLNRDEEAPEDEHEAAIPWKQKFSNYEKVHDSSNYDQLPDQEEETFVWSNRVGDCYKWCKLKKDVLNNIGCGRRSAANFCSSGGPTTKAQRNAKSPVDTWSLMIPDDEVMKIVNYTNKKIIESHDIIGEWLRETDKKSITSWRH